MKIFERRLHQTVYDVALKWMLSQVRFISSEVIVLLNRILVNSLKQVILSGSLKVLIRLVAQTLNSKLRRYLIEFWTT